MRVGLLTSWRVPCGIYQYTSRLADALAKQGHEPVILAGRADEHRSVPEESKHEVRDVAGIGLWRDDGLYWLDANRLCMEYNLDVVHVQYQSMLFKTGDLQQLAQNIKSGRYPSHGPVAITYHDNCQTPDFPYHVFDLHFSHRWNVGPPQVEVIPFGIEDRLPVVRSFGLGRTRSDIIGALCDSRGWIYESAASHEPIQGGGQSWKPHDKLIEWLRGADAIVLWYDDQPMAGSSLAVRTAIATRRPVFTNDTKWFEDMPYHLKTTAGDRYYHQLPDLEALEMNLERLFERPYVQLNSWDEVAKLLVGRYAQHTAV